MVEYDHVCIVGFDGNTDFLGLALADKQACLGRIPGTGDRYDRFGACRTNELREFLQIFLAGALGKVHMDENSTFTTFRAFEQTGTPLS